MLTVITGCQGTGKTIIANALKNINKLDLIYDDVDYILPQKKRQHILNIINKSLKSKKNVGIIVHNEKYLLDNLNLKDETIRIINISMRYVKNTKLSRGSLT
jgi:shikimate kinase